MQSPAQQKYYYDAKGKLISRVDSGSTNDIVAGNYLLNPELPLLSTKEPPVLNSPNLYQDPISKNVPPFSASEMQRSNSKVRSGTVTDLGGISMASSVKE